MFVATREMLMEHLLLLPAVMDKYAARDPRFIAAAVEWLSAGEQILARLRNPLTSMLATERSKIVAAQDGYQEPGGRRQVPAHKAARIAASQALSRAEAELRAVVIDIDARLAPLRDKMAQLLAVASTSQPIPVRGDAPHDEWVHGVWMILKQSYEGRSLAAYLSSALAPSDLRSVLGETLDNLLAQVG